jgi:hypothetical protein
VTSTWGGGGGYIDFSVQDTSNSKWVAYYWTTGTCLTGLVLLLSIFYITVEVCHNQTQRFSMTALTYRKWCQQSFLSTEDYKDAMNGLRMTRDYRALTYSFRATSRFVAKFTFDPLESLGVRIGLIKMRQKTLVWTKTHFHDPPPRRPPPRPASQHAASPFIELTLSPDSLYDEGAFRDTPAMAHSLFPPAHTNRRSRNESDASFTESTLPIYEQYRTSDDSHRPWIQRPSDVHRSRATPANHDGRHKQDRRRSSELSEPRSSSEYLLSPTSIYLDQSTYGGRLVLDATVQSRQGYRRANSDPGSPPMDVVAEVERSGLGIDLDASEKSMSLQQN